VSQPGQAVRPSQFFQAVLVFLRPIGRRAFANRGGWERSVTGRTWGGADYRDNEGIIEGRNSCSLLVGKDVRRGVL